MPIASPSSRLFYPSRSEGVDGDIHALEEMLKVRLTDKLARVLTNWLHLKQ